MKSRPMILFAALLAFSILGAAQDAQRGEPSAHAQERISGKFVTNC